MTIEAQIHAGDAVLAFDTNAIVAPRKEEKRLSFSSFFTICDLVSRLRAHEHDALSLRVVVPALVHLEVMHDLRTFHAKGFLPAKVAQNLRSKGIEVKAFDENAAIVASGTLFKWFDTDEKWQNAKRERCLQALGNPTVAQSARGLASIDWAIATQAEAEGWILVTGDKGAEFQQVTCKITKDELRKILEKALEERQAKLAMP